MRRRIGSGLTDPDTDAREAYQRKGEIALKISSPPPLISEESGLGRVLRQTFASSVAGVLWSFEKLIVGIALAGPWIVLAILVILVWRRARRKAKPAS